MSSVEDETSGETPASTNRFRLALLLALLLALMVLGYLSGVRDYVDTQYVRSSVEAAGIWGVFLFWGMFTLGVFVQIPGMVFVAAAAYAYGTAGGLAVSLVGALLAVTVSFVTVRKIGGQPAAQISWSFARKLLDQLDERPLLTVVLLRLVLWMSPPLNYALALTRIRFRDYVLGSALGLLPVIIVFSLFFEALIDRVQS